MGLSFDQPTQEAQLSFRTSVRPSVRVHRDSDWLLLRRREKEARSRQLLKQLFLPQRRHNDSIFVLSNTLLLRQMSENQRVANGKRSLSEEEKTRRRERERRRSLSEEQRRLERENVRDETIKFIKTQANRETSERQRQRLLMENFSEEN